MVTFQDINYKTREIELPQFGNVLIATTALNDKLLNEKGAYVSEEALKVDEQIFYFVEENEIELPITELKTVLINQVR